MEDIIIRGGTVIDGTGAPGYRADVAVRDGIIAAIGDLSGVSANRTLDAEGLIVAPGFIDSHAHSDVSFLKDDSGASKLYQGVTTEVTGNCGSSPFPALPERLRENDGDGWRCASFDEFMNRFERGGYRMGVNQAMLVGHGSLRAGVVGCDDRPATPVEMEQMKALLRRDLEAGAWGMSLGLEYAPGFFAGPEELNELGAVVRAFDGLVPCHMRSEGLRIDAAIEELLDVGRASGARVHVSHLKLDHYSVHGRAPQIWARIEQARREGVRVSADMYPFTASYTSLTIRCPKWSQEGGGEAVVGFLNGPRRAEVVEGIRAHYFSAERAETCLFSNDGGLWPDIVGKTLRQVAEDMLHTDDYAEAAARVLIRTRGRASCIFFVMSEKDMLYFLAQDIGIGSDGYALSGDPARVPGRPHPRSYAALSEFFRLARTHGLCSLEEAVRRVTSKPADVIGLTDRGRLRVGMTADITVFDPQAIAPRATYLQPIQLSAGVRHVLIGGGVALTDGDQTDLRAGRFLRKNRP
ncbi:MAG: D-aminoacylase [Clostridia bacterium]|nr:D-aminoacylase [Clostridia bacterium]